MFALVFCMHRPDVTFNLRMMKALQMMEVPLLKSWVHTNVMEGFTKGILCFFTVVEFERQASCQCSI